MLSLLLEEYGTITIKLGLQSGGVFAGRVGEARRRPWGTGEMPCAKSMQRTHRRARRSRICMGSWRQHASKPWKRSWTVRRRERPPGFFLEGISLRSVDRSPPRIPPHAALPSEGFCQRPPALPFGQPSVGYLAPLGSPGAMRSKGPGPDGRSLWERG